MGISDLIARFILENIDMETGCALLQRSELAQRFGCVPSQINYVITTRFTPEHGYVVESRRGGGGYIRIRRIQNSPEHMLMHTVNAVGERIDFNTAKAFVSNLLGAGMFDTKMSTLIIAAISDRALISVPVEQRDTVRAGVFKQLLIHVD